MPLGSVGSEEDSDIREIFSVCVGRKGWRWRYKNFFWGGGGAPLCATLSKPNVSRLVLQKVKDLTS